MTFGWPDADLSILIKNYEVLDNNIIIQYLDGTYHTLPCTKENEHKILNIMIDQAIERNHKMYSIKLTSEKFTLVEGILCISLLKYFKYLSFSGTLNELNKLFGSNLDIAIVGIYILIASSGLFSLHLSMITDEAIQELTKYEIFLSIREKLEELQSEEVLYQQQSSLDIIKAYKMDGHKYYPLNINTIDNFSLEDIRNISDNLSLYYKNCENSPQFIKRKPANDISN